MGNKFGEYEPQYKILRCFVHLFICSMVQDVFTVSVGNLPPKASVIIKITYVAELQVEGELINFTLPASVAPWDRDPALSQVTQVSHWNLKGDREGKV